jgi:putative hydrolase of the HAD superfamily
MSGTVNSKRPIKATLVLLLLRGDGRIAVFAIRTALPRVASNHHARGWGFGVVFAGRGVLTLGCAEGRKVAVIEAITFDLWQTLIRETSESAGKVKEGRTRNLYMLLQEQGYPGTLEEVQAAYDKAGGCLREMWAQHRDVGPEGQVQLLLEALDDGWELPQDRMVLANLEWAYVSPILKAPPVLNSGAGELLNEVRERYRLGLICNTGRTPGAMLKIVLQRLGILEYFDVLTFSDVVGIRKPDPQIFHLTLEQLRVPPHRALHIGDDPRTDVAGARRAGMWAVLLGSPEGSSLQDDRVRAIENLGELPRILQGVTLWDQTVQGS